MQSVTKEALKNELEDALNRIERRQDFLKQSCVVFVYNSFGKADSSDLHISECVYESEIALIRDALQFFSYLKLFSYDDEAIFLQDAPSLKNRFRYVFVYSMAQNLNGTGRRCLVPLLCEYYGFHNISSDSRSSFLGGDKRLMHRLLHQKTKQPTRMFLSSDQKFNLDSFCAQHPKFFVKPIGESASIGVRLFDSGNDHDEIAAYVKDALARYRSIMLEEYISGEEVECSVFPWKNRLYFSDPVHIVKNTPYLDYETVKNECYRFELYDSDVELLRRNVSVAYDELGFDSIARFDFICNEQGATLFDITPNPTISECSSACTATRPLYRNDARTPYLLLLCNRMLLIPAFDHGE